MASNTLDDLIFSSTAARNRATDHAGTQTVFVDAVVAAILTAVTSGAFTATIAISTTSSKDLQWVMEELRHDGYSVVISSTNLVVTW